MIPRPKFVLVIAGVLVPALVAAQAPSARPAGAAGIHASATTPVINYTLRITPGDTTGFDVEIDLRNTGDSFRLAMPRHPEYDEKYWRYVSNLTVDAHGLATRPAVRLDSALWLIRDAHGPVMVTYRVNVPPPPSLPRAAWRPFISSQGALIGGPYGVMYMVGAEHEPSHVRIDVPAGWSIATSLEPTSDPRVFYASNVMDLDDSPILAGRLRDWHFEIDGVPHRVAYLPAADATPFDTTGFVDRIRRVATQAIALFGRAPYREYTFLVEDGAYGALEHANSVTLGIPSGELARDLDGPMEEIAHEYFHAWNIMRIRPAEYPSVTWTSFPPASGLWWSEGLTMFYADLLLRRAGIRAEDSTRIAHLESLIGRYYAQPGNWHVSPEWVSRAEYEAPPDALGDWQASTHLQGELLGTMLDFKVRSATYGKRTIDDLMLEMMRRYGYGKGFHSGDIAGVVASVCGCETKSFFDTYIRGSTPIDFNRYLGLVGMRVDTTSRGAVDSAGVPIPDRRIYVWNTPDGVPHLLLDSPTSAWGRAGLHSGDVIVSMNGVPVANFTAFRQLLVHWRVGDSVRVVVSRPSGRYATTVVIAQARPVIAHITDRPAATAEQRSLRAAWDAGQ